MSETLLGLAVCLGVYLYILLVEAPRQKRRQRQRLRDAGYGFLNEPD